MHIKEIIPIITSVLTIISSNVQSMDSLDSEHSWLPNRLQSKETEIRILIKAEKPASIIQTVKNENIKLGRSFVIDDAQRLCLKTISDLYDGANERRPIVADIAAGHGYMTWKMIVAGGNVTAVEPQDPTREELIKNAKKSLPFLSPNEKLKDISRNSKASALDFENAYVYKDKRNYYDIIWTGNFLHLLTPKEAMSYVTKLYEVTKRGGYTFATAYGPLISKEVLSSFLQRKEKREEYPGYMITNIRETGYQIRTNPQNKMQEIILMNYNLSYFPINTTSQEYSPMERISGEYNDKILKPKCQNEPGLLEPYGEKRLNPNDGKIYQSAASIYHMAFHCFDIDTFRNLFERAGFYVEDVFYMNMGNGKRINETIYLSDLVDTHINKIWVGIKAKKI